MQAIFNWFAHWFAPSARLAMDDAAIAEYTKARLGATLPPLVV